MTMLIKNRSDEEARKVSKNIRSENFVGIVQVIYVPNIPCNCLKFAILTEIIYVIRVNTRFSCLDGCCHIYDSSPDDCYVDQLI